MRRARFFWLDVFTRHPFTGNGLVVFPDAQELSDAEMQAIARETNQSETSFVLPPTADGATYRVRIFTPAQELPFAGHPTLGTAFALVSSGRLPWGELVQESPSGLTHVFVSPDKVVLQAPPPRILGEVDAARVSRAVGAPVLHPTLVESGIRHLVAHVPDPADLAAARPDTAALVQLSEELGCTGAFLFSLQDAGNAYLRARLFAPLYGITEDPATGSAGAPLGAYLHRHGLLPGSASSFWYEQGVEMGRPSRLWLEVAGNADGGVRVAVGGQVTMVGEGEYRLP